MLSKTMVGLGNECNNQKHMVGMSGNTADGFLCGKWTLHSSCVNFARYRKRIFPLFQKPNISIWIKYEIDPQSVLNADQGSILYFIFNPN